MSPRDADARDAESAIGVLVVEDEPRLRELLARAMRDWGFTVAEARSAEEALRQMDASAAELIILDLNLPGMGGMEFFGVVRERWPKAQVIILTGFGDLDAARQAIRLNVVDFLTKPCHLGELEVAMDRAVRRRMELDGPPPERPEPIVPPPDPSTPMTLDELERQAIMAALTRNRGNRAATAAELGISLRTLYYRLTEYQKKGLLP